MDRQTQKKAMDVEKLVACESVWYNKYNIILGYVHFKSPRLECQNVIILSVKYRNGPINQKKYSLEGNVFAEIRHYKWQAFFIYILKFSSVQKNFNIRS